jgi:hypothetical protein
VFSLFSLKPVLREKVFSLFSLKPVMLLGTGENSSPLPLQSEYEQRSTKMSIGEASAETLASIFGSSGETLASISSAPQPPQPVSSQLLR